MLFVVPATVAAAPDASTHIPLHWLWNEQQNDSAYTIDAERRDRMVRERGYVDMGTIAYVDALPAPDARPLKCFYSSPRTDTFCSISSLEHRIVRALGYEEVATEGFVQRSRVPGSVALFRMSRPYGAGADLEHRFVISRDELMRLRKQKWTYDGAKGYVYPLP